MVLEATEGQPSTSLNILHGLQETKLVPESPHSSHTHAVAERLLKQSTPAENWRGDVGDTEGIHAG